jgi:hypothetical protein
MKYDREILLQTAHGKASAQKFGHAPVREEGDLRNTVDDPERLRVRAKLAFERRPAMRHGQQADGKPLLLEPL